MKNSSVHIYRFANFTYTRHIMWLKIYLIGFEPTKSNKYNVKNDSHPNPGILSAPELV